MLAPAPSGRVVAGVLAPVGRHRVGERDIHRASIITAAHAGQLSVYIHAVPLLGALITTKHQFGSHGTGA
jgi:hypothetical protein